jgi:hypothetical protein
VLKPNPATLAARVEDRWRWPIAIVLAAAAAMYAFWPIAKLTRGWNDFSFLYAAGRTWLAGLSPYDFDHWNVEWAAVRPIQIVTEPTPFVYPPHWGPFAALLALLPWPVASRIWDAVNVLAYLGTCALSLRLLDTDVRRLAARPAIWVFLAITTLNVAVRQSVFNGQFTIVVSLGIAGAFFAWHEKKTAWLVVFAFIASLKPQLGFLPLLYILLNGGHLAVLSAGAIAGGVALLSMLPSHLERVPADFAHVMALHTRMEFNQPAQYFNVPALAAGHLSGQSFMMSGPIAAVIVVVVMTVMRRRDMAPAVLRDPLWQFSIVAALTGALMPVHVYDLVVYVPLGLLAYRLRSSWTSLLLLVGILSAGRSHVFAAYVNLAPPPPLVTGAVALTVLTAAFRYRRQPRVVPDDAGQLVPTHHAEGVFS